jgi:hypothetical protein
MYYTWKPSGYSSIRVCLLTDKQRAQNVRAGSQGVLPKRVKDYYFKALYQVTRTKNPMNLDYIRLSFLQDV